MDWYYMENEQRIGPVTDADFEERVRAGMIRPETPVWHIGMEKWARFSMIQPPPPGDETLVAEPPTAAPKSDQICCLCGKAYGPDSLIRFKDNLVCWSCKPAFIQRLKEGAGVPGAFVFCGFWRRFAAKIIDGLLLGIAGAALSIVVGLALRPAPTVPPNLGRHMIIQAVTMLLGMGIGVSYNTWFLGKHGATPGKMALGIKVVLPNGKPVSYSKAFGRYFAELISSIILGIGYLMVAFDDQKRALHDRICDTRVIRA